jgi:peptide/nickel transport system substrate-binding protein
MIVPEGASDEALRTSPDGTGPYALAAWQPDERIRLTRNEKYWGGAPSIREAELSLYRTNDQLLEGLRAGRYDVIECNSKALVPGLDKNQGFRVFRVDSFFVPYLGWDLSRRTTPFCRITPNPFRDVRVRKATAMAINRESLRASLPGYASPATQPVPRLAFGFDPSIPEIPHDVDQARRLLQEAGFAKGFDVVLHTRQVFEEAAALVARDLREIDIRTEVRILSNTEFFALESHGATLWIDRYASNSGDATDFLESFVHSADQGHDVGTYNYGGYSNPDLDKAIERSAVLENVDDRRRMLQGIMATTMRDLVLAPLYDDQDVYAVATSLVWQPRGDRFMKVAEITRPAGP